MSLTIPRHSVAVYFPTGSAVWQAVHFPANIRRPVVSVSAEAPCDAATSAGVTGGATGPSAAQPPSASAPRAADTHGILRRIEPKERSELEAENRAHLEVGLAVDVGDLPHTGQRGEGFAEAQ